MVIETFICDLIMSMSMTFQINLLYNLVCRSLCHWLSGFCFCFVIWLILFRPGARGPFLESPSNLPGQISIFLNVFFFFADYAVITDMVLGQCFHRIIRFKI